MGNQSLTVKFVPWTKTPQKFLKTESPTNTFKVDKADSKDFLNCLVDINLHCMVSESKCFAEFGNFVGFY